MSNKINVFFFPKQIHTIHEVGLIRLQNGERAVCGYFPNLGNQTLVTLVTISLAIQRKLGTMETDNEPLPG
jgi:hypothetical protein